MTLMTLKRLRARNSTRPSRLTVAKVAGSREMDFWPCPLGESLCLTLLDWPGTALREMSETLGREKSKFIGSQSTKEKKGKSKRAPVMMAAAAQKFLIA